MGHSPILEGTRLLGDSVPLFRELTDLRVCLGLVLPTRSLPVTPRCQSTTWSFITKVWTAHRSVRPSIGCP